MALLVRLVDVSAAVDGVAEDESPKQQSQRFLMTSPSPSVFRRPGLGFPRMAVEARHAEVGGEDVGGASWTSGRVFCPSPMAVLRGHVDGIVRRLAVAVDAAGDAVGVVCRSGRPVSPMAVLDGLLAVGFDAS